ncbi:uncharacterized protein GJ701_017306 isoform 1-T2 [Geothlypis trichas]
MSWWGQAGGGFGSMVLSYLIEKFLEMVSYVFRGTNKECNMDEAFQELMKTIQALQEDLKKLEESRQREHQLLREYLEKNQGNKEEKIAQALESKLKKSLQRLSQKVRSLEKNVQEGPETTKWARLILEAFLERNPGNKEVKIALALEPKWKKNLQQLSQKIKTLEEDVKEWPETTKNDLQLLRTELERNPGNKEEEIAQALESKLKKSLQHLSQKVQSLEENVQECLETTKHDLQPLRAYLGKSKGKQDHCQADFHLSEGRRCSTGQPPCELLLLSSSEGMGRDSPYLTRGSKKLTVVMGYTTTIHPD